MAHCDIRQENYGAPRVFGTCDRSDLGYGRHFSVGGVVVELPCLIRPQSTEAGFGQGTAWVFTMVRNNLPFKVDDSVFDSVGSVSLVSLYPFSSPVGRRPGARI